MLQKVKAQIQSLSFKRRLDFGYFVAHATKQDKQRILKKAADQAIKEQRKIIQNSPISR